VGYSENGLSLNGSITVNGTLKDRYCMDEYEGVLRIATTVSETVYSYTSDDDNETTSNIGSLPLNASLYCYDLSTKQLIASVERFAPDGEQVMSARFLGTTAYVCTAVQIYYPTDPVYAFDLSDYQAITSVDSGTITGYSLSLVSFTDDTLLGIGFGDSLNDLKIELYRKTDSSVESVAKYTALDTVFSSDEFKAYLIDKENGLVGLSVIQYSSNGDFYGYLLFQYDGYNLVNIAEVDTQVTDPNSARATYLDGYVYILGSTGLFVEKVN
jgi:uncharacterized secreted protein with C-terminal beta-propeller domain